MRSLFLLGSLCLLLTPLSAQEAVRTAREKQAANAAADELLKLAKLCISNNAYSGARDELQRGFALSGAPKFLAEIRKIAAKPDAAKPEFDYAEKRAAAHEKAATLLVEAAIASRKDGKIDAAERLLWSAAQHVPSKASFEKAELSYFEPYLTWVTREDAKRLEAGDERIDGKWVAAATVQELDRKHSTWNDPWVLSDEVHEVYTTQPMRTARQLMAHTAAQRAFLLRTFAGLWDLRAPAGKLRVYVTANQADHRECIRKDCTRHGVQVPDLSRPVNPMYARTIKPLNSCFVTFEMPDRGGSGTHPLAIGDVICDLKHEVTHQVAYEYAMYGNDKTRLAMDHIWAAEGLAYFIGTLHVLEDGEWRPTRARTALRNDSVVLNRFARCIDNRASLPTIEEFVLRDFNRFLSDPLNDAMAATLTYFFMSTGGEKYRPRFTRLLEIVHQAKETKASFDECFKGVDKKALQKEWLAFIEGLKLDD